ncbi:MAG: CreA family protein [Magnetococcales bacterium]|nr:CreA family protein [Magnetococcales bacterium]
MNKARTGLLLALSLLYPGYSSGEEIGSVDTSFKFLGPDDKIVIEAFDDPKISGVTCHLSRSKKGGVKGGLGLAEDLSEASIACRQIGPINFKKDDIREGEEVFAKSTSLLFKKLNVVRFFDKKRNVLVYLTYSDKLIDGSPKNSISTVPIMPWKQD